MSHKTTTGPIVLRLKNKPKSHALLKKLGLLLLATFWLITPTVVAEVTPPTNFFGETGAILDVEDPLLDDKGPGYYQYPLDPSLPRGTYDLKRFSAYEEGNAITFVIQMRDYIPTLSSAVKYNPDQGFIGLMFDIYIDMDRKPGSGHTKALPSRQIEFADGMGWEKMILATPLSQYRVYDALKNKTDDLEFQDTLNDIIIPDYVQVQRDKILIRIKKDLLGKPSPNWGMQCFVMGFSNVVSTNQVYNKDVRAFPTKEDLGGGYDTLGDPPIMDCIVPENEEQFPLLRDYRSEPFAENIQKARLPFVYASKAPSQADKTKEKGKETVIAPDGKPESKPVKGTPATRFSGISSSQDDNVSPPAICTYDSGLGSIRGPHSEDALGAAQPPAILAPPQQPTPSAGNFLPITKKPAVVNRPKGATVMQAAEKPTGGFIPIKKVPAKAKTRVATSPFVPIPKNSAGFIPIKKGGTKE